MIEALTLASAAALGFLFGAAFYGGLWWTVQRGVLSERAPHWFLASLLLRTALAVTGFYFVAGGHWQRLLLCFLGFVVARLAVTWLPRPPRQEHSRPATEGSHAP